MTRVSVHDASVVCESKEERSLSLSCSQTPGLIYHQHLRKIESTSLEALRQASTSIRFPTSFGDSSPTEKPHPIVVDQTWHYFGGFEASGYIFLGEAEV